nr:hypothetical protein [Tanacetum cinerariifolium]
ILDEHLLKFHSIKNTKSLLEAMKIRFGGNKESKKMHKTILKQQYENFVVSRFVGLDKTYDRFQKLISQLELNGEVISQEDANMKLQWSLPPAWNNIALIMRNKPDIETLSKDESSTSTARPKVNTAAIRPNMNAKCSYFKPHFPKRKNFNQISAAKTNTFLRKINTAKGKIVTTAGPKAVVNAAEGKKETAVKTSAGCVWRPKITYLNNVSKDSSGSWI